MVAITDIGGIPKQESPRNTTSRGREKPVDGKKATDAIYLSEAARETARALQASVDSAKEIRQERVQEARKKIEQGSYRIQDIVTQVAERIGCIIQ